MSRNGTLMDRLAAADPAAHAGLTEGRRPEDLREAILAQPPAPPPAERPVAVRSPRPWGRLAAAAVALGAATALILTGVEPTQRASAAAVLGAAADRLAQQPSLVPGAGQFYYRRAEGHDLGVWVDGPESTRVVRTRVIHEIWVAPDGSGRIVRRDLDPQVLSTSAPVLAASPAPRSGDGLDVLSLSQTTRAEPPVPAGPSQPPAAEAAKKAAAADQTPGLIDELEPAGTMMVPFGQGSLSMAEFLALPTDPARLAERIAAGASRNSRPLAYQELDLVAEALRNAPVPPALGAAIYNALGLLPGIEALGQRTDALGRRSQAVGADDGTGLRLELIIDPATGQLLADREVATSADTGLGIQPGEVAHEYTYVARGVVDSVRERAR
jgi:hypothetical protein